MSKTIVSPVKKWQGTVILHDPLTVSMAMAFETSRDNASEVKDKLKEIHFEEKTFKDITAAKFTNAWLPGVLACVEKFNLVGFPENVGIDNFPATPKISSASLLAWLIAEITQLYQEADEVPNA